ncbi:hypothetical protein EOK76_g2725 [Lacticaseibacillus paracasei]|nr:hypothetical protein EOK76_g2725 [Lacticaseibacillus paracasei]
MVYLFPGQKYNFSGTTSLAGNSLLLLDHTQQIRSDFTFLNIFKQLLQ